MQLNALDWLIIGLNFALVLGVGLWVAKRSGKDTDSFFLGRRTMPWWLLGASMVATTFSADTPNLVTDIVRQDGVAGNWVWWAFLVSGMITVFLYARLWRRSGVMTDMEFYELRYDGRSAAFLRGFRALYLGLAFNVIVLSVVCLAAIKIGQVMLGLTPVETIVIASVLTAVLSCTGGFLGVLLTDVVLFVTAMIGSILAAWYALGHPDVGGLSGLLEHENVREHLRLVPAMFEDGVISKDFIKLMFVPLAVQWWASWYPGAEPGGGGYIAQRMLAAKSENHALGATLMFNVAHYALRPWPWILVALCSLVVYPDLASLQAAFPNVAEKSVGHDLAYPAMLTFLPHGVLGLVVASLAAAFISTVSTHLNWGASYLVNDSYKRFVKPEASERELIWVARVVTVSTMALAALLALQLENAKQIFDFILMFGAGSGLIFMLRWFWWRVNAPAEIAAMVGSGVVALVMQVDAVAEWVPDPWDFPVAVGLTTVIWVTTMFLTAPVGAERLASFVEKLNPAGSGWRHVRAGLPNTGPEPDSLKLGLFGAFLGCTVVYSALFGIGLLIYGRMAQAGMAAALCVMSALLLTALLRSGARQAKIEHGPR